MHGPTVDRSRPSHRAHLHTLRDVVNANEGTGMEPANCVCFGYTGSGRGAVPQMPPFCGAVPLWVAGGGGRSQNRGEAAPLENEAGPARLKFRGCCC